MTPDTLLIVSGFSFADAHISARIDECLTANPSTSVFAFQFKPLEKENFACNIAARRANMSVYSPDRAMINGVSAPWQIGPPPTRDWGPIRAGYWGVEDGAAEASFRLGRADRLAHFFANSRSEQSFQIIQAMSAPPPQPDSSV